MKKGIAALALSLALTFGAGTVLASELPAQEAEAAEIQLTEEQADGIKGDEAPGTGESGDNQDQENNEDPGANEDPGDNKEPEEPAKPVWSVTIKFNKNGGKGTMSKLVVSSDKAKTKLPKNSFKKESYTFMGWNTEKNGTGKNYKDKADVAKLATKKNNGKTITLYAKWKINAPKLKNLKTTVPGALKISYKKVAKASSYQLQYATDKKFKKNKKTVDIKKSLSNIELTNFVPNKTYYVRIRSYDKKADKYSDWSNTLSKKTKNGSTLYNTSASTAIEADVKLTGSGTGYHAKLVLVTPTSAVSYGLQFDQYASAPYTGKMVTLIENVKSNAPGQQQYTRPSGQSLVKNKTYHLMLTIDSKGNGNVYLDYKKIGSFSNPNMANVAVYPRVEAAVRLTNDSVTAVFDNIKLTRGGVVQENIGNGNVMESNKGIGVKVKNQTKVTISGKGVGIRGDWDSDYENASGIYQW